MLNKEEIIALIKLAQLGDEQACETIVKENLPLVKSIIKRYKNKGVEYDDLFQLGSVGLLKAIKNFSPEFDVCFSTYAVPMISGEIKRFLRDDGYIKVSRSIKTLSYKISKFIERYKLNNGKSPSVNEIAKEFKIDQHEVVYAMDSALYPVSLYDKGDDEQGLSLGEKIADKFSIDDQIDKITIKEAISKLSEREQQLIILRYYKDKTQTEVAKFLNVSQVQVSRLETKIIKKIKEEFIDVVD